jgi:two-component system capsular synthesis sensor histidine kinase RcsC
MTIEPGGAKPIAQPGALAGRLPLAGNVLVVDDSEDLRKLVKLQLRQLGVSAQVAENGLVAVEAAAAGGFDAVLMDMEMPIMKGHEAIRVLRERGFSAPIIAMTAHYMNREVELAQAAGCNAVLTKPASIDNLRTALRPWLAK